MLVSDHEFDVGAQYTPIAEIRQPCAADEVAVVREDNVLLSAEQTR
jgi:hypothetical protein